MYLEVYVLKNNGLNYNTFVMIFCKPTLYDYFKRLFCYKYDNYIEYKLFKNTQQEMLCGKYNC